VVVGKDVESVVGVDEANVVDSVVGGVEVEDNFVEKSVVVGHALVSVVEVRLVYMGVQVSVRVTV
jgi:small basic protein